MQRDFGIDRPNIGMVGLNPHAGEAVLLGREEADIWAPALRILRGPQGGADRFQVSDPLAADGLFARRPISYDAVLCGYHDQGLIPLKAISFDEAVNVTLGLPIVRTSVDHGTAMDIAWQGKANYQSMLAAIRMAIDLC